MKDKRTVKVYPFALYRIEAFSDYLNRMYHSGFKITKILFGFILFFEPVKPKDTIKCIILTRHFYRNMRHEKWNDADFLAKRNKGFVKGNGFLLDEYAWFASSIYEIYLTRALDSDDLAELKKYRKNRIIRANLLKAVEWLIVLATLCLGCYDQFYN